MKCLNCGKPFEDGEIVIHAIISVYDKDNGDVEHDDDWGVFHQKCIYATNEKKEVI